MSELKNEIEKRMDNIERELKIKETKDTTRILSDDMDNIKMKIEEIKNETEIQDIKQTQNIFADQVKNLTVNLNAFKEEIQDIDNIDGIKIKEGIMNIEDKFSEFKAEVDNRVSDGFSDVHQALLDR